MADNWWEQDLVKDEETEQESQNWWEQDIVENEPTAALPESTVINEELVVNPELQTYAQELQDIQGGYEEADLEAAGFSTEDIKLFNDSIATEQDASGEASGDGGGIYMGVPSTDMYEGISTEPSFVIDYVQRLNEPTLAVHIFQPLGSKNIQRGEIN